MLMGEIYSFIFLFIVAGLGLISHYFLHRMNTVPILKIQEERNPESFIGERAYRNLKALNDFGPKVVGSRANEELAVNYILNELSEIKNNATRSSDIDIRHQFATGVFKFKENYIINYVNVQNVIVKLQGEDDHALLVNCHFDSVAGSPGASDDIVSCCVMMEILRVLAKSRYALRHSIIFLFNGAEEVGLAAADGFITKHEWAPDCRAVVNLESTGSGGRELLFQSGPKNDWIVKMYQKAAPRPFGQAVANELFESGIIPSATDFQVFTKIGNIPGLDFAYVQDGWRYHTRYDSVDYIPLESVQHTGNNILPLIKKIANSQELANPPEGSHSVYFDYLGLFFVTYTQAVGIVLNISISTLAVVIPFIIQTKFKLGNIGFVLTETLLSFAATVIGILLSAAACYGLAELMSFLDRTMTWYNNTFLSIGMYCGLAVLVQILVYHALQTRYCLETKKYKEASARRRAKISLNGVNLFWAIFTITLTAMGYRFAYVSMVMLLVSLCTYLLTFGACKILQKTSTQSWIFLHIFGHMFSFVQLCYAILLLWYFFIPIVTKVYMQNADITIALICTLWTVVCLSYFIPLTLLLKYRAMLYTSLVTIIGVSLILAFTSSGFPYSDSAHAPRLQRFVTLHAKRTLYDPSGNVLFSNGSAVIYQNDRNAHKTLLDAFGENGVKNLQGHDLCDKQYNCGYPDFAHEHAVIVSHFYEVPIMQPTIFTLIRAQRAGSLVEVEFKLSLVTGLTTMTISPALGMKFNSELSSVQTAEVIQNGRAHQLLQFVHGKGSGDVSIEFVLEGNPEDSDVIATIGIQAVDSTFHFGPQNDNFKEIMNKFPDYTFSYVRQADCSLYQIAAQ